jgi:hypothetical protein
MYDEFLDEFNRVIKDKDLAEANDQNAPSEYGVENSYLDMVLGEMMKDYIMLERQLKLFRRKDLNSTWIT